MSYDASWTSVLPLEATASPLMNINQNSKLTWLGIIASSLIVLWVVITVILKR